MRWICSFAKQFEPQDRDAFLAARLAEAAFDDWKGSRDENDSMLGDVGLKMML